MVWCRTILLLMGVSCSLGSYDEFLSCDRGDSGRTARALEVAAAIQQHCDMSRQSYCHYKSAAYPERAITQFLAENLGLMKRMGGELDPRDVKREMRSTSWLVKNSHNEEDERLDKTSSFSLGLMPSSESMFQGLSGLNINGQQYLLKQGSGLAMVKNAQDSMMQSRTEPEEYVLPTVFRETTERPSPGRSTSESISTSTSQTTVRVSSSQSSSTPTTQPTTASIAPSTVTTELPGTTTDMEAMETTWMFPQEETTPPADEYEYLYDLEDVEGAEPLVAVMEPVSEEPSVYLDLTAYDMTDYQDDLQKLNPVDLEDILDTDVGMPTTGTDVVDDAIEETLEILKEELGPEITPHQQEEPSYLGDPINACEVDSTIEAPYWANNTGGKTLALLNLYPFEQYIHIETCMSEMTEGLCRSGCRCEQQHRLHRLLAFDPNNECRGIFSDWFSFPSFCLCKCYGVKEMLQGSRDPKKADITPANKGHKLGPGPTHNKEQRREPKDSKLTNHRLSGVPAVFPYEGRAALFAELQQYSDQEFEAARSGRPTGRGSQLADSVETVETLWSLGSSGHIDNTVESDLENNRKSQKQGRGLDADNFFYNQPIMDFALPDGTVGTLKQTPRK